MRHTVVKMQYNFSTLHHSYKYMRFNNILLLLTNRNPYGRHKLLTVKQVAILRIIIKASQLRTLTLADSR